MSLPTVRAKFALHEIHQHAYCADDRTLVFHAVCDDGTPENQLFAKYTPCGEFRMNCNNPAALAQFKLGKSYYLDFTPVD